MSHPSSLAWIKEILLTLIAFTCLQFLLFLPLYLTRSMEGDFFPDLYPLPYALITRANPDIFRWSLDYALIFSLSLLFQKKIKITILSGVMGAIYFLLFLFQSYYFIVWKIYGEIPVWSYDWALLQRVLPVYFKTMGLSPMIFKLILLVTAAIGIFLCIRVHRWMLRKTQSIPVGVWCALSIFILGLPLGLHSVTHSSESNATKSAILWITNNIKTNLSHSRIKSLPTDLDHVPYSNYKNLALKSKPNIELIFIEAYGSILGTVDGYDSAYIHQLQLFGKSLSEHQWYAASALSNSTILGGRSWLGFTTFLSGLRIDNHPAYEQFIKNHVGYPHLINTLNHYGYKSYRLNTMAGTGDDFRTLDSMAGAFFGNKIWTRYPDIPYKGYKYDYLGGVPDQYALNYWHDQVLDPGTQPYFLFFITLNTHAPFYLPPPVLGDWQSLDTILKSPHKTIRSEHNKPIVRYAQEVNYILKVLEKYILEKGTDNTMYILVGDHQPAGMEYMIQEKTDVYATPIHIISKDSLWNQVFLQEGMRPGMVPEFKTGSLLHHEGFYSFFMSTWAKRDSLLSPVPYLKNGFE